MFATEGKQIYHKLTILKLLGIDSNDICLTVDKNSIFNGDLNIFGNLNLNSQLILNSLKFIENPQKDYTLRCIDNEGTIGWNKTEDYRFLGNSSVINYTGNLFNSSNIQCSNLSVSRINNFISIGTTQNLLNISGNVSINNDLFVNGNLLIGGTQTIISSNNLSITNSLIKLADGNTDDIIDIGFYGSYTDEESIKYTGLFRNNENKIYTLFDNLINEPTSSIVDKTFLNYSDLKLNNLFFNNLFYSTTCSINNDTFFNNGNLSIGTTDSNYKLNLNGDFNLNNVIINSNNNFGIYTENPTEKIHLNDNVKIIGGITGTILSIHKNNTLNSVFNINNSGLIGINNDNPEYSLDIKSTNIDWSQKINNTNTNLYFANNIGNGILIDTGDITDNTYNLMSKNDNEVLFKVQNDGKVGINTDTPTEILDVMGNNLGDGAQIGNMKIETWLGSTSSCALVHSDLKNNSNSYMLRQHSSGETYLNCGISKNIHFSCDNNELMTLKGNGFLGINNIMPSYNLDIIGNARISGNLLLGSYNFNIVNTSSDIILGTTSNIINCDTSSGNKNIILPEIPPNSGIFYYIFKKSNLNTLNIFCSGTDKFEDDSTLIQLIDNRERIFLMGNTGFWYSM